MPLRLVFFGTPTFAVPTLRALASSRHPVVAVVTQPDRPRGRGQKISASPVKTAAADLGIPTCQPARLRETAFSAELRALAPDLGVVAAYGKILPADVIDLPRLGMINVHASLLPRWRGAAPIHRAILAGDTVTGVTIMRVVRALDAGPMLAVAETPIDANETSADLETRLATMGAELSVRIVEALAHGPVRELPQDDTRAVYAARLERGDSRLDFARPAREVHNTIRGLHPWPLASAVLNGQRLVLLGSEALPDAATSAIPGTILQVEPDALVVATGRGAIRVRRVQREGRPAVSVRDFLNGHHARPGDRFAPLPAAET